MKITCHSCGAKYTVSDEKVQGKTVKMKCRKCGSTIVVGGASGAAEAGGDDASIAAADAPAAGSYLVNVGENDQRTMTLAEVVEAYNGGVISADTYVFTDGMADWQALQENEVIVAALNEAALASAAYGSGGANGGYQEPAAAASAPAYDPAPFNQPAAASFSPAPAADARPAAARRDAGRKSQDLFGGGGYGADAGGGMSTASAIGSAGTGKREENSVLFSLNALTANAPAAKSSATTATKEDSGLIDLKALAAAAPPAQAEAAPTPMIDTVGLFPLGAPVAAPQPAYAAPIAATPADTKKSPLPLIVGGVVAVAAIVGVFLFVLRGGEPEKKPETAKAETTQTATAAPPPTQTVAAVATTTATGADTAAPDPSGAASVAAGPKGPKGPYKPGPKSTGAAAAGTPTSTGAKPPPPKDKCNCGGNLDCQIKCSIKGK